MRPSIRIHPSERGIALVMAVISLLVIAVIALVLTTSLNMEKRLAGHDVRDSKALNLAEAGVAEALSRIRSQDIALSTANPRAVAQIFLAPAGSVPVLGADSTGLETAQPTGEWLNYSTPTKSRDALTVEFKTDANKTVIYRYDSNLNPPIQTTSGLPVYRVTSTGRAGQNRVRIQSDVIQKPFNVSVQGAFMAGVPVNFSGNSDVCGYNHTANAPAGTKGRPPCDDYETGNGNLAGGWSTGNITTPGSSVQNGVPQISQGNAGQFFDGPWEVFGMGQAEFWSWLGAPVGSEPGSPNGIYYLDDNGTQMDQSGNFAYHGGNGEGFLYIDGDLTINGNFNYKGLIYIEGDLKVNGTTWILGALVVRGKTTVKLANGSCTVLYSSEAIQQSIARYGGQFVTLSWRQIPLN